MVVHLWCCEGDGVGVHVCAPMYICVHLHACICALQLHTGFAHCHLLPPRSEYSGSSNSLRTLSSYCCDPPATWDPLTLCPDWEDRAPPPGGAHHEEDGSQGLASCSGECGLTAPGGDFCSHDLEKQAGRDQTGTGA